MDSVDMAILKFWILDKIGNFEIFDPISLQKVICGPYGPQFLEEISYMDRKDHIFLVESPYMGRAVHIFLVESLYKIQSQTYIP